MASYLVLALLTLFLCKWTTSVLGCEKKSDCREKDDSQGISTTTLVIIIVVSPIVVIICCAMCVCECCQDDMGSSTYRPWWWRLCHWWIRRSWWGLGWWLGWWRRGRWGLWRRGRWWGWRRGRWWGWRRGWWMLKETIAISRPVTDFYGLIEDKCVLKCRKTTTELEIS